MPRTRSASALLLLSGAAALICETLWVKQLSRVVGVEIHAVTIGLSAFFAGLAIGSVVFGRMADRSARPLRLYATLEIRAAVLAMTSAVALARAAPLYVSLQDSVGVLAWLLPCVLVAAPACLIGGTLLAMLRALRPDDRRVAPATGLLYAANTMGAVGGTLATPFLLVPAFGIMGAGLFASALQFSAAGVALAVDTLALNTLGGIAGTLLTGFVLVPWLGLVRALGLLAVAGAIMGAVAFRKGRGSSAGAGAMVAGIVAVALFTPPDKMSRLLAEKRGGQLRFYEAGAGGTVAVIEQRAPAGAFRHLYIQGVSNSGDTPASLRYMRLQALLPLLLHAAEPRSALVGGLGIGITAGALLADSSLERRVVAELLPAVVRAVPLFAGNLGLASDPRVEIRVGDGRHELLRRTERYDLITLEPPPPSAAGVANLYSRDFYELCRDRLRRGGLMAQWWPLAAQNDEDSRSLARSFLDVFPYATVWTTELYEMLLVGSTSPITLDGRRIAARFSRPDTARVLGEAGIESAAALLATWISDRPGLEAYAGDAPAVTDDRPIIEHAAWVRRGEFQRVLPRVLAFATDVPLGHDDPLRADVQAERRELQAFYRFALHASAGERAEAAIALEEALGRDPSNPYYRWMALGGQ